MKTIEDIGIRCTACRACEQICPQNAITMKENEEGFLYPIINREKCNNCGLCYRKCHINLTKKEIQEKQYFALKPKDKRISKLSTSGGIAYILSKYVIENGGIVFGSIMDENLYVKHIGANTQDSLEKFRGSKYVISDTQHTFKETKEKLEKGIRVLYIGTACQIAGLKAFLGKEYEELLTVDIVCHGVPSNKIFQKYIKSLELKYKDKIVKYEFRNKDKTDWGMGYTAKITTRKNKIRYIKADFDPYYTNFLKKNICRECCYQCKYANVNKKMADLTIADFWGIEKFRPYFYDRYGVSLCVVNTEKGKKYIEELKKILEIEKSNYNEAVFLNKNLSNNNLIIRPVIRDTIYQGIDELEANKYVKKNLRIDRNIRIYLKRFAPHKIRMIYKKYLKK